MDRAALRTVTVFHWRIRINSLSSWWYCACALSLEGYLLYRAVNFCCRYNELPWRRSEERPVFELYAYIALIVANVMCLPFIVVFSLFQVGNYANDGVRLGRDSTRAERIRIEVTAAGEEIATPDGAGIGLLSSWRHVGPLAQGVHVLAAFCLLLPRVLVQAQEIKFEFLPIEAVWWSDFDSIIGRHGEVNNPQVTSTVNFSSSVSSSASSSMSSTTAAEHLALDSAISFHLHPEFLNYCLALFFYSLRYAAVFWYTEIVLSILFSFQLTLSAAYFALSFCGTSVLYKILVNPEVIGSVDPLASHNFMLTSVLLLGLSLAANFITFLSPIVIFNFGYSHYRRAWKLFLKRGVPMSVRFHDDAEEIVRMETCCHGYTQHILATVYLLTMVGLRLPVVFDYVTVYKASSSVVILASLLADVIVLLGWIFLWFLFTVRQKWNFKVILTRQLVWDTACDDHLDRTQVAAGHLRDKRIASSVDHGNRHDYHQTDDRTDLSMADHGNDHIDDDGRDHNRADTRSRQIADIRKTGKAYQKKSHRAEHKTSRERQRNSVPAVFCSCTSSRSCDAQAEEICLRKNPVENSRSYLSNTNASKPTHRVSPTTTKRKRPWTETLDDETRQSSSPTPGSFRTNLELDSHNFAVSSTKFGQNMEVHCSKPDSVCDVDIEEGGLGSRGGKNSLKVSSENVTSGTTSPTPDSTLTRWYHCNVRDKCGEYFRHAGCHKSKPNKLFRKRPPAPSPSPNRIPLAAGCCELAKENSKRGTSPAMDPSSADSTSPGHSEFIYAHSPRMLRPRMGFPKASVSLNPMLLSEQTMATHRIPGRSEVMSRSSVHLNSNHVPSVREPQSLSQSADALDDNHAGVRGYSGSVSASVLKTGADRTIRRLERPHSMISDANKTGIGIDDSEEDLHCHLSSHHFISNMSADKTIADHLHNGLPPSCQGLGSHSTSQHLFCPSSSFSSHLLPPPPPLRSSVILLPPPPPPPPPPAPPPPTLAKVPNLTELSGEPSALPMTNDASSSDSTNSQMLCSQV